MKIINYSYSGVMIKVENFKISQTCTPPVKLIRVDGKFRRVLDEELDEYIPLPIIDDSIIRPYKRKKGLNRI